MNGAKRVERPIGQRKTLVHDLQAAVRIIANDDFLTRERRCPFRRIENEYHLVIAQRQGLRERADLLAAHGTVEVLMGGEGTMHVFRITRWFTETSVEIDNEFLGVIVGSVYRIDTAEPQLLDQSILQGLVGPFNPALGLWSVGADDVDVQLIECASKLRQPTGSIFLRSVRRAKHAVLVAIKSQRLAPLLQIGLCRVQIIESVLGSRKAQM